MRSKAGSQLPTAAATAVGPRDEFVAKVDYTIDRAQRSLIARQQPEGYWQAALEANAQMNAEFIIFNHFMDAVDLELEARLKKHLLDTQNADGSWSSIRAREGYLSISIEAYFALKLAGYARRRRADDAGAALDSVPGRNRSSAERWRASTWPRWDRCRGKRPRRCRSRSRCCRTGSPFNMYELSLVGARYDVRR